MSTKSQDLSSLILVEHRCSCGKLLFKGLLVSSTIEIKCKGCGKMNLIQQNGTSLENKNQYSILFDEAANIIETSTSIAEILGFSHEKLVARKAGEKNFAFMMHSAQKLWQTGKTLNFQPFTFETAHIKKNGQVLPVRANIQFIKNKTKIFALAVFEPLETQAKQFEYQNIHAEVMDFNCEFVADVNMSGVYTYVNRGLTSLLGYSPDEMLGQPMFKFYPEDEQKRLEATFLRHLKPKQSFKLLARQVVCKNGEPVSFENYFVAKVNDVGELKGFRVIMV